MKKELRINFTDFYSGFNKTNNYVFNVLSSRYTVIIDENDPDYLIYSCFGRDFLHYECIRIFYSGENIIPDFNLCDYATGFAHLSFGDRYARFPNFVTYGAELQFINKKRKMDGPDTGKNKFCNFIYSNGNADPARDRFYHLLSKYKPVDAAGKHLNNTVLAGTEKGWASDKVEFMSNYKFSIAFENSSLPGYTTEKIIHAFVAGTIPVYWGDPLIDVDFNPNAFINCHAYKNLKEVVEKVIELDQSNDQYMQMYNQPVFIDKEPVYMQKDYLLNFFSNIMEQPVETAFRRTKFGQNSFYENQYKKLVSEAEGYRKSLKGIKGLVKSIFRKPGY
jgi:hypothetical protein